MASELLSAAVVLALVIDPLGNVPLVNAMLAGLAPGRRRLVILRECAIAFATLALFMLFGRSRSLKAIPATLALVAVVTSFGPWGAYAVSRRSQSARLTALLERQGLLAGGKVAHAAKDVAPEQVREISASVDYLATTHGGRSLRRWSQPQSSLERRCD